MSRVKITPKRDLTKMLKELEQGIIETGEQVSREKQAIEET